MAQFRHLRPGLGRWLKRDPAGDVDGPNLYRYAMNRPTFFTDPSGLLVLGFRGAGASSIPIFGPTRITTADEDYGIDEIVKSLVDNHGVPERQARVFSHAPSQAELQGELDVCREEEPIVVVGFSRGAFFALQEMFPQVTLPNGRSQIDLLIAIDPVSGSTTGATAPGQAKKVISFRQSEDPRRRFHGVPVVGARNILVGSRSPATGSAGTFISYDGINHGLMPDIQPVQQRVIQEILAVPDITKVFE